MLEDSENLLEFKGLLEDSKDIFELKVLKELDFEIILKKPKTHKEFLNKVYANLMILVT